MRYMKFLISSLILINLAAHNPSQAQSHKSFKEIVATYKAAHEGKDFVKFLSLVQFQSKDKTKRIIWENDFKNESTKNIKKLSLSSIEKEIPPQYIKRMKSELDPSIHLEKCLVVESFTQDKNVTTSQVYLIGQKQGTYFIVGP